MKSKLKNRWKLIIAGITIISLLTGSIYIYATQSVEIKVYKTPKIDIVLTQRNNNLDLTNFNRDLKAKLETAGVDTEYVNIQTIGSSVVTSNSASAGEIFNNWGRAGATGIWSYNGSTGEIVNAENTDNMTGFYNPNDFAAKDATISYYATSTDADDDAMGGMIRFSKNANGTFSGYIFLLTNSISGSWCSHPGLYKIVNNSFHQSSLVLCQSINNTWTRNVWTNYKITAEGNNIKVYQNNNLIVNYTDPNPITSGSYGFFSWSQAQSKYKNVVANVTRTKTYSQVLQEPTWRDGSIRAIIDIEDTANDQFNESSSYYSSILSKTLNDKISFIGWGTDTNKTQMEYLIEKNDDNGIFIDNTDYERALNETVDYICELIDRNTKDTNTIIAEEPVEVKVIRPITGVETPTEAFPNGVWKVVHDENYYENPQNQYEYDGMYTNELISEFRNVGKYLIYCEDKLVKEVYAHRRPVVIFDMEVNGTEVNLQSKSEDLDIETQGQIRDRQIANKGIAIEKWEYRKQDETNWTQIRSNGTGNTLSVSLEENTNYIIRLTVTDYQGEEVEQTKYVTTGESNLKPEAIFQIVDKQISVYEELEIIDSSYDPAGKTLIAYNWKVINTDTNSEVYSGTTPQLNYSSLGVGNYSMQLVVTNSSGVTSQAYTQNFEVTKDTTAPIITIDPTTNTIQNDKLPIKIKIEDKESGLQSYKYVITDSPNPVSIE